MLYGDYLSPYSVSAAHALLEKDLSWEYKHVNLLTFETRVRRFSILANDYTSNRLVTRA